jgi:hypothetical protein
MKSRSLKTAALFFVASALIVLFIGYGSPGVAQGDAEEKVTRPGSRLVFPALVWTRIFPGELTGVAIARNTGEVAALTKSKVYYFRGDSPNPTWTAGEGEGWKLSQDLYISRDGRRVLFQTDTKKKRTTETKSLTMHLFDGEGNRQWDKPNPFRYQNAMLSPSGKYILVGEMMHGGSKCYDDNLNLLWEKNIWFWYVAFDPLEHFIFDGEGGVLYTIDGDQVWNFGAHTLILSVSDDAEFVMSKYYRTVGTSQRMFLMGRLALKKIELAGTGGCVSPDGLFTAYVNDDKKLVVYRTREVLEAGGRELAPLYETRFVKPWSMNISRDNRTLFVMGQESALRWVIMLVDLTSMKTAWKKTVEDTLRIALPTDDNRYVVIKPVYNSLVKYRCY